MTQSVNKREYQFSPSGLYDHNPKHYAFDRRIHGTPNVVVEQERTVDWIVFWVVTVVGLVLVMVW